MPVVADVRDLAALRTGVQGGVDTLGDIDVVVANAGVVAILTSSAQGLVGRGGDGSAAMFAYAAAKHGVVGLMRSAANAYAQHSIRVNGRVIPAASPHR